VVKEGNTREVLQEAREVAKRDSFGLKRRFLASLGNEDILMSKSKVPYYASRGEHIQEAREVIREVMQEIKKFAKEVEAAGGEFSVTSLIPSPAEVDKQYTIQ
jgi:hypothetical protein